MTPTIAATRHLSVTILGPGTTAKCGQCGKPAIAQLEVAPGEFVYQCRAHLRLAIDHYTQAHDIR